MTTPFALTVTLFHSNARLWQAALVTPEGLENITEWLPNRTQAENEARHWFDNTIGPGHRISFEVVRDLRRQE